MSKKLRDYILSFTFLLPALLLLAVFILYPVFSTLRLSFNSWRGIFGVPLKYVGLENYDQVLTSSTFWNAMLNSGYFMVGTFLILMPLAFMLGLLVTSKLRGTGFMKTMYYLPVILGTTTVALMWRGMLNPNSGVLAGILAAIGRDDLIVDWLSLPTVNIITTVLVNSWMFSGFNMLIFAAGLSAISDVINEAATIDGCSNLQRTWYITIPLCKNSFKIFSILGITGCLKVFDIVFAMTGGGPNQASATPGILVYQFAYAYRNYGRSSAVAMILLVLGVTLSASLNRILRQEDLY
ncbi:MAG: sugar ABC transporter permease [Sphaerochaeta sp.]